MEGATSGIGRLERMKHGNGIMDRDDRSIGAEILISDSFVKINPTDPLRLTPKDYPRKQREERVYWWCVMNR
jgi:hypothetical protein